MGVADEGNRRQNADRAGPHGRDFDLDGVLLGSDVTILSRERNCPEPEIPLPTVTVNS